MIPEMVVQHGVEKAWEFLREHSFLLGHLLREMEVDRQQTYKQMIENEKPSIVFGFGTSAPPAPSFSVILLGEDEAQAYVGDDGLEDREIPYPAPYPEDYPNEVHEFFGVTYGQDNRAKLISVNGVRGNREIEFHGVVQKNTGIQPAGGDEQWEEMGEVQRLWNRLGQRLSQEAVLDRIRVGIEVRTDNAEKTAVYYRLLKWVLRRFTLWFQVNNVKNVVYSGGDLSPEESLSPTAGGSNIHKRMLTMTFEHEEHHFQVERLLAGWMLEVEMITPDGQGGQDVTPLVTVESDDPDGT